jgi:hypothetical protein
MRNKLVSFLSLALLVSSIPQHLSADNDSVKRFVAPEGFTFDLPTGWKRLPNETLAAYEKLSGDAMPNMPRRKMAYAFHLDERMDVIGHSSRRLLLAIHYLSPLGCMASRRRKFLRSEVHGISSTKPRTES